MNIFRYKLLVCKLKNIKIVIFYDIICIMILIKYIEEEKSYIERRERETEKDREREKARDKNKKIINIIC